MRQKPTHDKVLIEKLFGQYAEAKSELNLAEAVMRETQEALINEMERQGHTTVTGEDGKKGTLVRGSRLDIDSERLRKSVGARMWEKITVRVLDKKLLESAIALKEIDPVVVSAATEDRPISPYVRISEAKGGRGG